jgi:hypothetical protein
MCDCLGFELWLKSIDLGKFSLDIESAVVSVEAQSNSVKISEWFAKTIETICDIKCTATTID